MTTAIFVGEDAVSRARPLQHVYALAFVLNMARLVEQLARLVSVAKPKISHKIGVYNSIFFHFLLDIRVCLLAHSQHASKQTRITL
jgi:hypothetical protein